MAVMAYACPPHFSHQQEHNTQAQQPPAQHKEQDTVLKSIKQATGRIAQLELLSKLKRSDRNNMKR